MGPTIQVGGSLNSPFYRGPMATGITFCVLAPVAYALEELGWQGFGQFRPIVMLLRFAGPIWLMAGGVSGLALALAARMALVARRRDLEVTPAGFATVDRRGRRDFEDAQVTALGVRSRSAPRGTVDAQRGRGSIWVDGRDGDERLDLAWEYADAEGDPLSGLFGRLLDRLHAGAVRAIDSGGSIAGDGWELSGLGLRPRGWPAPRPFAEIAQAEFHAGELRIWKQGEVEPCFSVAEGSRNDAILQAIAAERVSAAARDAPCEGLGRVLFERRWSVVDRLGLWLLCGALAALGVFISVVMVRQDGFSPLAVIPATVGLLSLLPAIVREGSVFRCHRGGVARSGLFGRVELPYEDMARVVAKRRDDTGSFQVAFKPIPGRGRRPIRLTLKGTDEGLETLRSLAPGASEIG